MKFRDLGAQYAALKNEIDKGIADVIASNAFILGAPVGELETALAAYVGRRHCVSCGNGTDALQLSLVTLGVGEGDAVFTSDFTYFASAGAASLVGATPIFVDIDLATFNIDPAALENAICRVEKEGKLKPKAIIPVDLFGQPAAYPAIEKIAKAHGLFILEDAAQGFGGEIAGKRAGSFGDISATSFFPAKPLGCYGDGGAVFTDSDEVAARLRSLRAQGKTPTDKYDNREVGMNSRLDTIQAAILLPKLKAFADYELAAVNRVAAWYNERLADKFQTPFVPQNYLSSWAQYTLLLEKGTDRPALQAELKDAGVPTMIYYPRGLHAQQAYAYMGLADTLFPNTTEACRRVLSLPMHPYLSEEDVDTVCAALLSCRK